MAGQVNSTVHLPRLRGRQEIRGILIPEFLVGEYGKCKVRSVEC